MHKILIEDIETAPNKVLEYHFDDCIEEFKNNFTADLTLKSLGEFIEVSGNLRGKVQLVCDRCLEEYEEELNIKIEETFAKQSLQDEYSQDFEISGGQFVTDLNGAEEIDIYDLLYQSVILYLPNKKVCGINCKGTYVSDEDIKVHDSRMDVFKNIRIEQE